MSDSELEEWRQQKISQGIVEAKGIGTILAIESSFGLAARLTLWFRSFAYPLKYARYRRLQPYNPATGRYMTSDSLYTNGEMLIHRTTPYISGVTDFATSTLLGIPAYNWYGLVGAVVGEQTNPQELLR